MQTVRGVRFGNAGGFKSSYTPPLFSDVEPRRLHLLQQLRNGRGLDFDVQVTVAWWGSSGPAPFGPTCGSPFPLKGRRLRTLLVVRELLRSAGCLPC